jgi:hypothetical protein
MKPISAMLAALCAAGFTVGAKKLGPPVADESIDWMPISNSPRMSGAAKARYNSAIRLTADMASNPSAKQLASRYGLDILNLTWEDTGRYKNSAVGSNISDMTIQVDSNPGGPVCMPVIRHPNYSDISTDIDPHDFTLLVGNQEGTSLKRISLYDFLRDPTAFLSNPKSWLGHHRSLLAARDSKVLVSAQACFLPIPQEGQATFNPVLFNYQSVSGDPAVLTILATREGTSVTVIDNKRDSFSEGASWGQRLFHNNKGMRASLTGERESDYNANAAAHGERLARPGMSMVLLIQVPLKQRELPRRAYSMDEMSVAKSVPSPMAAGAADRSDVERAVIGHGEDEGIFTEIDNLAIQRDERYPVRVTVQFYKATSNGLVNQGDLEAIKHDIDSVYAHGEVVGSLVTGGDTGRPTEYYGCKVQPADWWDRFWERNERNTGLTKEEAIAKLRRLLGRSYQERPVSELYLRDLFKF